MYGEMGMPRAPLRDLAEVAGRARNTFIAGRATLPLRASEGRRQTIEADRPSDVDFPLGLLPQPGVVDPLIHFLQGPPGGMRGLHVVAQEVHVAADGDRLAWRSVEVRWDARHQELGMVPHDDEVAAPRGDARHLSVQRAQIGEVLVRQRLHTELVRLGREAGVRDVGEAQGAVDALGPGDVQHLRRDVGEVLQGELAVAAAEEREESKQVEQEGNHRAGIFPRSEATDQPLARRRSFGEGQGAPL
jgi:hypothetical protein